MSKSNKEALINSIKSNSGDFSDGKLHNITELAKDNSKAAIAITASCFLFAVQAMMHKFLFVHADIDAYFQAFVKYCTLSGISYLFMRYHNVDMIKENTYVRKNYRNVMIRINAGMFSMLFLVIASKYVKGSTIGIGNSLVPLISIILSAYLIKDQVLTARDMITFLICLVASLLLLNPFTEFNIESINDMVNHNSLLGYISLLLFVLGYSVRNVYQKFIAKLNLNYNIYIMSLYVSMCSAILTFFFDSFTRYGYNDILYVMIIGVIDYTSLYLNMYAISIGDMLVVQQFIYLTLPFVSLLSFFVLGEVISLYQWLLILIIFACNTYRSYLNYLDEHKK